MVNLNIDCAPASLRDAASEQPFAGIEFANFKRPKNQFANKRIAQMCESAA